MNPKTIPQLIKFRTVTQSPAEWAAYKKDQAEKIAGKVEKNKSEKFAEYIDEVFMSVCQELNVFDMARDWAKKSEFEKLTMADNIVRRFVECIKSDMNDAKAKKYNDTIIESIPKIYVARSAKGCMSVSTDGQVNINPDNLPYKDLVLFLMDLRHEVAHIVDIFFPSLSPLEPDIRNKAMIFYEKEDKRLYSQNPLEINANTGRKNFGDILRAKIALCEYNRVHNAMRIGGIGHIMRLR